MMLRPLQPYVEYPVVHGPATSGVAALVNWLEQHSDAVVRLPVLVARAVPGSTRGSRLITRSTEELPLQLDDSALGISLSDRARQACPEAVDCSMWLDGRWRGSSFFVTRARGAITEEGPLFARLELPDARPEVVALVDKLGSAASMPEKQEAGRALIAAGRDAIPVLIASLGDGRPYEVRDLANRMNLPLNAKVEALPATISVGSRCEELLYAIVTPTPDVAPGSFKVFSTQVLSVKDWRAFQAARKDKALEEIHHELRPLVNKYWQEHGMTQVVP